MPVAHDASPVQELKGKFLIKGKRLNKLEASFAAADDADVTEEDEANNGDKDELKEEEKKKVGCPAE